MNSPLQNVPQPLTRPVVVRVPAAVDIIVVELFEHRSECFAHLSLEEFYGQIIATHPSVRVHLLPVTSLTKTPLSLLSNQDASTPTPRAEDEL